MGGGGPPVPYAIAATFAHRRQGLRQRCRLSMLDPVVARRTKFEHDPLSLVHDGIVWKQRRHRRRPRDADDWHGFRNRRHRVFSTTSSGRSDGLAAKPDPFGDNSGISSYRVSAAPVTNAV